MKPPRHVQVGPYRYDVVVDEGALEEARRELELEKEGLVGAHRGMKNQIVLAPNLPQDLEAETLLHELLHAALAIFDPELSSKAEERLIGRLSPYLFGILRRNPRLVAYLTTEDPSG